MNLAIVGSHVLSEMQGELAWYLVVGVITCMRPTVIISGGAAGVDSVVETVAHRMGYWEDPAEGEARRLVVIRPEVPEWEPSYGRGYKARNEEIVSRLRLPFDKLVRIAKHEGQATYGSGWTADRAREVLGASRVLTYYL